jgi:predicted naringenin-chalcone synthase
MSVRIVALGTALPQHAYAQRDVLRMMQGWIGGERRTDRVLERIYRVSGIERRHSVLDDFLGGGEGSLFRNADGSLRSPGTAARNDRYGLEAPPLAEAAARAALARVPALDPERVTHLVTVSCTGFQAPGIDDHLVRALALKRGTERYHLGFMGCSAAFPALRMARAFCLADPEAVVLVVSVELCTLHLSPTREVDSILSTSLFADGAAAAIVTAADLEGDARPLELLATATTLTDEGRADMAWTIGDHGFDMVLTSYVPAALELEVAGALEPLLARAGSAVSDVDRWAVHPGGRAILDKVEAGLALPPCRLAASRDVLRDVGNMSSATILFVLERLTLPPPEGSVDRRAAPGETIAALAFGPGLTVDSALVRVG